MKIFVTGTRGIPQVPGGVESHCEKLYPILVQLGHEVILARRSTYMQDSLTEWQGIKLVDIYTPKKKSIEAIIHTFLAILSAKKHKADIIHIHAIGPGLLVPFARVLGLKVVVTNHGPDYDREKWNWLAKKVLKLGEYFGCKFANEVIVISRVIEDIVQTRCNRKSHLIYNGVTPPPNNIASDYIKKLGTTPNNYIFSAARFVPEKGLHDLVEAFKKSELSCQLIIAGDADHEDDYSKKLKQLAASDPRIILTGFITGEKLQQVFHNAKLFILPSYHEGLPISLLEALSHQLSVLVSDIPANRAVNLRGQRYFKCGDVNHLTEKLNELFSLPNDSNETTEIATMLEQDYNWDTIAKQTFHVYKNA